MECTGKCKGNLLEGDSVDVGFGLNHQVSCDEWECTCEEEGFFD